MSRSTRSENSTTAATAGVRVATISGESTAPAAAPAVGSSAACGSESRTAATAGQVGVVIAAGASGRRVPVELHILHSDCRTGIDEQRPSRAECAAAAAHAQTAAPALRRAIDDCQVADRDGARRNKKDLVAVLAINSQHLRPSILDRD